MSLVLEICSTHFGIAKSAAEAGAHRLELCQDLHCGGTTPSYAFIKRCCEELEIPIRVLIRPRGGNFCYGQDEIELMLEDITICRTLGVEAVVTGALDTDLHLHKQHNIAIISAAGNMKVLFHRGIDICTENEAIGKLRDMGFAGILTSGQAPNVSAGIDRLEEMQQNFGIEMEIVAGGGINAENVTDIVNRGIKSIHFSCQTVLNNAKMGRIVTSPIDAYNFQDIFDHQKWTRLCLVLAGTLS